jgi:hypothetical protein
MWARDAYISAKRKFDDLKEPFGKALENNQISVEEWADQVTKLEFACGVPEARNKLLSAERALVNWAKKKLQSEATPEQMEQVSIVWEKWWYPNIRDKVINLCMRLES